MRTEFERADKTEDEVKEIAGKVKPTSIYLRVWLGQQVYIWDLKESVKKQPKNRRARKFICGIASEV
ncbi:DUF3977 family protein [Streptococcus caballi]